MPPWPPGVDRAAADLAAADMAAARWAWERGEAAGPRHRHPAQTPLDLPAAAGRASRAGRGRRRGRRPGAGSERAAALAVLDQGAVALERAELAGQAVETETLRRTDRFRAALLNSVSHDLRTPLSTVLGSATTLIDYGDTLKPEVRADLLTSIREEAERLNRYVGDLLDMTRLEGGGAERRGRLDRHPRRPDAAADRVSGGWAAAT